MAAPPTGTLGMAAVVDSQYDLSFRLAYEQVPMLQEEKGMVEKTGMQEPA